MVKYNSIFFLIQIILFVSLTLSFYLYFADVTEIFTFSNATDGCLALLFLILHFSLKFFRTRVSHKLANVNIINLRVYSLSFFLGLITPGRLGEFSRILGNDSKLSNAKSGFKPLISEKVADLSLFVILSILLLSIELIGKSPTFYLVFGASFISLLLIKKFSAKNLFIFIVLTIAANFFYILGLAVFISKIPALTIDEYLTLILGILSSAVPLSIGGFGVREFFLVHLNEFFEFDFNLIYAFPKVFILNLCISGFFLLVSNILNNSKKV